MWQCSAQIICSIKRKRKVKKIANFKVEILSVVEFSFCLVELEFADESKLSGKPRQQR
jgi:hypothetical protein